MEGVMEGVLSWKKYVRKEGGVCRARGRAGAGRKPARMFTCCTVYHKPQLFCAVCGILKLLFATPLHKGVFEYEICRLDAVCGAVRGREPREYRAGHPPRGGDLQRGGHPGPRRSLRRRR